MISADEKRERRQAKHELQGALRKQYARRAGLYATTPQLDAGAKRMADIYIKLTRMDMERRG